VHPGRDLLVARTADEWVATVCELLTDAQRRCELGSAARGYVEQQHHWDRCLRPLVEKMFPAP
jgi:hypothetical protein